MSGLILDMPKVAVMMLIGMAGMFVAPFGMLISKWAVLKAVVDAYPSLTVFIVFGSSATLFFWVKWMGKLLEVVRPHHPVEKELTPGQTVALYGLSAATFLTCLFFPKISSSFIEPYVIGVYGQTASMTPGNIVIMTIMMLMVLLFPLSFLHYGRGVKVMDAYLGGANLHSSTRFLGSGNAEENVAMNNYYLRNFFSEAWLSRCGVLCGSAFLAVMVAIGLWWAKGPGADAQGSKSATPGPAPKSLTFATFPKNT
jgi:ech hydrogenase subunit A